MLSAVQQYTPVSDQSASIIVAFPCTVMFLLLKFPSHISVAVAGSLLNDRLILITTSYRVVVVERSGRA